ncbi:CSD domain-containing protein [Plasmodiophora brassicae]|uniref:CSD domain-containing protein n=1 Tax=Plasmodiophora brassicae TaxID=37360 RepID=A0A0G4J004_PLABS|nr:hypothetical protein PBRA_008227 [Plasmodiophora brassicae]SPR01220.1 unnamed protein product [Plasmodiophora brassicae]
MMVPLQHVRRATIRPGCRLIATGTVKWFNRPKGFGFITQDADQKDIFVHHTCIQADGYRFLNDGERVQFDVTGPPERLQAINVTAEGGGPFIREGTFQAGDIDFGGVETANMASHSAYLERGQDE